MELNGVANIKLLTDQMDELLKEDKSQFGEWAGISDKIRKQLDWLERYMLAYRDAAQDACEISASEEKTQSIEPPMWYEVVRNPEKFETLREKIERK